MHNQLTKKDIEDMEKEIEHRKVVVRKELLDDVKEARAQGDLSENFEYYAAKKAKNHGQKREKYNYRTTIINAKVHRIDNKKGERHSKNIPVPFSVSEVDTENADKIGDDRNSVPKKEHKYNIDNSFNVRKIHIKSPYTEYTEF